ncbi:MAG: rRNA pseudouridine synthase [Planctomycetes bacterium]|nr:rRNA pseudouridine synthase [Planctomycetota bacterium]
MLTTLSDPPGRPTVRDLLPRALWGAMPVGRLDRASSGLLLFTNDHDLGDRVAGGGCEKVYRVLVPGRHAPERFAPLRAGMDLDGKRLRPMAVRVLRRMSDATLLEITLREGKNRQIRRALARLGLAVRALERVAIGPVPLGALAPGETRPLTREEVAALRRCCARAPRAPDGPR